MDFFTPQLILWWVAWTAAAAVLAILSALLIGRSCRRAGVPPRRFHWRFLAPLLTTPVILVLSALGPMALAGWLDIDLLALLSLLVTPIVHWFACSAIFRWIALPKTEQQPRLLLAWLPMILSFALLLPPIGQTLCRGRYVAKASIDGTHLNGIGKGLGMYLDEQKAYPDDLRRLVDVGFVTHYQMVAVYGNRRQDPSWQTNNPYTGPVDWQLIQLPPGAPGDLLWVWQSPEFYDGEGAWALFHDGQVKWLKPEDIEQQVARSQQWLRGHTLTDMSSSPGRPE